MKAVVIGGGIIGLCSAYYLQKGGWDVTILDKTDLTDGCSYGNSGMIVPSHFVPLAAPGMLSKGIKWMFNSKSPFYVRPSLNPDLISWGLKFIRSATRQNVEKAAIPLRDINLLSKKLYEILVSETGFDFALENKGILMYYKTEKVGEEEVHLAEKAKSLGLDAEILNRAAAQELEPETELDILGAVHYKCDAHLHPNKLIPQMIRNLASAGAHFATGSAVERIVTERGKIKKVVTANSEYEGDVVILAGGCWLTELTKMAGFSIPLMPGKGYSFTYIHPQKKLNVPAILCEARVAITPMNGHMRYGGTMEIAAVNKKINLKRVEGIIQSVPKYFPSIKPEMPEKKDIWFGFSLARPTACLILAIQKRSVT